MHGETTMANTKNARTQVNLLRDWLASGKKVTVDIARQKLGIGSLSRRICDLKAQGMNIKSRFIPYKRQFDGNTGHIKEYWLETESDQAA